MIPDYKIPSFDSTETPSHWLAPARNDTTEEIDKYDRYTPEAVTKNRNKSVNEFEDEAKGKNVKRHYIQNEAVSEQQIQILLDRLDIPTDTSWLLHAGFTGELGDVLAGDLNGDVIFTDPLEPWVDKATEKGLQAIQTRLQTCDGKHFAQVDGVATFEGYGGIYRDGDLLYEGLRCLTTEYGMTFFQSEFTRNCTRSTGNGTSVKGRFKAFEKGYPGVTSCYRENAGLRAYHMSADQETRQRILKDYLILYLIACSHRTTPDDATAGRSPKPLTPAVVDVLPEKLNVTYEEATHAFSRIEAVDYHLQNQINKNHTRRYNIGFPLENQVVMIENTTKPY